MLQERKSMKGASAMEDNIRPLPNALKPPRNLDEIHQRVSTNPSLLAKVATGDLQAIDEYFALMGATKVQSSEPYFPE